MEKKCNILAIEDFTEKLFIHEKTSAACSFNEILYL